MVSTHELMELADQLIVATIEGLIRWQETAEEEMFRANFKRGSVRIGAVGGYKEELGGFDSYKIVVLNKEGKVADEFVPVSNTDILKCQRLFAEARRCARVTGAVLAEIFEELKEHRS
jgi:hypothetical protein